MSATRDKNQRPAFQYKNIYSLVNSRRIEGTACVLKAGESAEPGAPVIKGYKPVEIIGETIKKKLESSRAAELPRLGLAPGLTISRSPQTPAQIPTQIQGVAHGVANGSSAVADLKKNLDALTELQGRLRFMLQELEDLVRD